MNTPPDGQLRDPRKKQTIQSLRRKIFPMIASYHKSSSTIEQPYKIETNKWWNKETIYSFREKTTYYYIYICIVYICVYIYAIHVLINHPLWEPPALHGGSQLSHRRRWSRCYPSGRCPMPRAGLMPGLMLKSVSVGTTCILLMYSYNCMYIHYIYMWNCISMFI